VLNVDPRTEQPAPAGTVARAAAVSVFAIFVLNGFNFASWAARLPALRDALGLEPAGVGLLLLVAAVGSLVALPLSGLVVDHIGARRTIVTFSVISASGLLIASLGVNLRLVVLVVIGLVFFGIGTGVWDAAMNLAGVAVEQRLGRAIMPRFHAGFSFGTMAGAGAGALAASLHASVLAHLGVALVLSTAGVLLSVRYLLPDPRDVARAATEPHASATGAVGGRGGTAPRGARARRAFAGWLEPRTLMIGLVVLAAALTEGSANDWVSLAVVDGFGTSHTGGALSFGLFVTAMTAMRLLGTGLLDRYGRIPVLRLSAGLAVAGLVAFGLGPSMPFALVGVALWGTGAALGFPVGMSAASDDPARAAARVSVVSTIGYSAFLAGPPLLGLLADSVGYRHALLVIVIPVVIGLAVIKAAAPLQVGGTAQPAVD
jgi:MFS family permease